MRRKREDAGRTGLLRRVGILCLLLGLTGVGVGWGQETTFPFSLSTPGARSLAMGGAFTGLADDATAAYSNPAGLTNLVAGGSEVAVEWRHWAYSNRFLWGGNLDGQPANVGIDVYPEVTFGTTETELSGLSFLSAAYVGKKGMTYAAYRHQLSDFEDLYLSQGFFVSTSHENQQPPDTPLSRCEDSQYFEATYDCRFFPSVTFTQLSIVNSGLTAAREYRFVRRKKGGTKAPTAEARDVSLSIGGGLSYYQMDLGLHRRFFAFGRQTGDRAPDRRPGGFFGPADVIPDNALYSQELAGKSSDIGLNVGLLLKWGPNRRWSLGAVYREGPELKYQARLVPGPRILRDEPDAQASPGDQGVLHVPDVAGLGIAYSTAQGKTKLALDYNWVRYSQRFDDLVPQSTPERGSFRVPDSHQIHLGGEKVVFVVESLFVGTVRAGVWYDPAHGPEYSGSDPFVGQLLPQEKDQLNWAAGLGLVIKEDFQIDAAVERSDRVNTVSVSLVSFF